MSDPRHGATVGKRLAALMADTHVKVRTALLPHETHYRAKATEAFLEQSESELAPTLRRAFQHVLDDDETPEEIKQFFRSMTGPEHQGQFFLVVASILGLAMAGPGAAASGLLQILKNGSFDRWPEVPLTPAELALAVVRGEASEGDAAHEARKSGTAEGRFDLLTRITGEAIAIEQLLLLYRRGQIDEGRLERGIRQSRIRNEWVPEVKQLRYAPPGAGEVIAAAVQNHLSIPEATRHLANAGIDPAEFQWLYETAGSPPGLHELLDLLNRGEFSENDMRQAIRESRVKDKYVDAMLKLRVHLMPMRTIVSAVRQGVIDDGAALQKLAHLGVPADDAAILVKEGHSTKTAGVREASASQVVQSYELGMVNKDAAHAQLVKLKFDDESANLLLDLGDHRRQMALRERAANRIGSAYIAHHTDRTTASAALDRIGMNTDERDHLLQLWEQERNTNVRTLTEAQIIRLMKKGLLTEAEAVARHIALGYTEPDARLLVSEWAPQPTTGGA